MSAFIALAVMLTLCAIALVAVPLIRVGGKGYRGTAVISAVLIGAAVYLAYGWISDYPWPSGDELLMAHAEAAIMADPAALTGEAGQIVEEVLQRRPEDPRALWYGGMAAISRGDNQSAKARWKRLLELSPPPEVRVILEKQIAALEESKPTSSESMDERSATAIPSIAVRITVAPELASTIGNPGNQAALFLIARLPEKSGPPLAVIRSPVSGFPADMVISDKDRMGAEPATGSFDAIQLTARISRSGDAAAAPGDLYGEALWQRKSDPTVQVVIDRVVK